MNYNASLYHDIQRIEKELKCMSICQASELNLVSYVLKFIINGMKHLLLLNLVDGYVGHL